MDRSILWPAAGIVGIILGVSFSFIYDSLWVGFFTALAIGVLILFGMNWWFSAKINSSGIRKTAGVLFAFLALTIVSNSIFEWVKASNQNDRLTEIRTTIDGAIAQMETEQVFIETMRYQFLHGDSLSIEEAFLKVAGDRLSEDGAYSSADESRNKALNYKVEVIDRDSIQIRVVTDIAEGESKDFKNYNGNTGRYEAIATLTSNGVNYERQN